MFPPWLLLLLAFIGEGESNLQIRKLNCDVTGEATTDESPLLLEKVCTSPSLTLQSSMEKVGDNPTRKVTLLLSSLSPILGVDQVNGNGSYITVVTSQDVPSDFDIEKTTKLDFDGNLNVNFPKACGTFYLISVLNISDGVKYIVSDDYVRIKRQCEDQGEINVNFTVSGSFDALLKMDSNGNLDTNGVTVTLLNNGPKGVSARTVMDAMVIRASIPDVTDEYWFRRLFYYYNVFNNNTTLQEVSDRLEWNLKLRDSLAATRLSGLETTLLDESKKVGIGMDPGDEKNIDLSLLKIPKSVIQKCPNAGLILLWLGLGVNVQDSNKNQQLILPIECNPGSTYSTDSPDSDKQLSAKECTILPSVSSDGKDAIFYRNQEYNSFKYDGSKKGFSSVSTYRLTDDLMKHAFISERAARLSALGLCPQPPIDDDPTQAIRCSLVQDINSLLNAMQQSLQNDESETTNRVSKVVDLLAALTNEYFKGQEKFMQFFTRLVTFSYRMTVSMIKKTGKTFGMQDESGNYGNNTNEGRRQLYKALDRSNAVIRKESEESEKCEFMCDNGKICVTTIMICDKRDDCMDGMDEQMCDKMGLSEKSARLLSSKINRDPSRGRDSRLTNVEQPEDIRGDVNMTLQAGARTGGQGSRTGRGRGTLRRPRDFDNFDDDQAFEDEENYRNGGDRREGGRSRDRFGRERNRGPDENSGEEDNFDDDQTFEDSFADTMDGENVRNGRDRRGGRRSRKGGERDRFGKERNRQPFENTGEGTESDFDDLNLSHNLEFFNNNNYNVSIDDEIFWKNTLKNIQNEISNGPRSSNGRKRNSDGTKSKRGKGGGKKPNTRSQKSCSDGRMSPMKSEDQKLKKWLERLYYSVSLANSARDIPEIDFIPSTIMDKIIDVLKQYDNGAFDTLVTPWMMYFDSVSQSNEFNPFMDKFEKLMMQVMQKGANFAALKTTTEDFLNYLIDTVSNDVSNFIGEEDPSLQAGLKSSLVVLNMVKDNFEAVINVVRKLLVFQRSKPYEWKMLNIPAGREPTEMMDCYRAAGMALTMEQEQTKKEEEKSPYYNLFDSLSERIKEKPIRWMQYKSGIYRGERSSLIGSVMWEKVATCSCRKTSYNYNYLQKDNEESVTLENDGKRSHSRSDDGNDIERNANELDSEVFVDIKSLLPKTSESFFDYDYGDFGLTPILPDKDEETGSDKPENSFRAINFPSPNNYYFTRRNAALRRQVEVVPVNSSIVRLAGGSKRRVNDEIIYRGMVTVQRRVPGTRAMDIGFICDHGWDAEDANVTCSILLNRVKRGVLKEFREIKGTELLDEYFQSMQRFLPPMMLKNVSCPIGAEDILLQCSYDGWYEQDCESYQRAGVECTFSIP